MKISWLQRHEDMKQTKHPVQQGVAKTRSKTKSWSKQILVQKFLLEQKFWTIIHFGHKIVFRPKINSGKKILGPKSFEYKIFSCDEQLKK